MNKWIYLLVISITTSIAFSQNTVSGTVVDDASIPIPGVNISVKGTTQGTITDFDGNFTLDGLELNQVIVFSYVGFKTQEITYSGQSTLNVQMAESAEALEEIVVIGYGTQKKELVSGAFTTVSSEEIVERNPALFADALQGSAAGVQVNASSGSPGAGFNIRIRGISTNGNNNPLVIVDGVIFGDGLDAIDPNDIKSIDIIKDASAAIYGVRATNGVILITTKSGRLNSKMKVNYNSFFSIQSTSRQLNLLNATEYAAYRNESDIADGNPLPFPNLQDLGKGTDWQDEMFETAPIISQSLSLTGGSENIAYSFTANLLEQDGIIAPEKSNFSRGTLKNNLNIKISDKLTLNTFTLYTNLKRKTIPETGRGSVLYYAANASPLSPIFDGTDGTGPSRGFTYLDQGIEMINPFAVIDNTFNDTQVNRFTGKIELEYDVLESLKVTSRFNYNYAIQEDRSYIPLQYYGPNKPQNNVGVNAAGDAFILDTNGDGDRDLYSIVNQSTQKFFDYQWESFMNYDKRFDKHNFQALAGFSFQSIQYDGLFGSGYLVNGPDNWDNAYLQNTQSFVIDEDETVEDGSNDVQREFLGASNGLNEERLYSIFGRIQYDFDSKYLFSAMLRRDSSSNFGPDNRIGYFPSFSGGWVLSNEEFFKSEFFNSLKLRGSWGVTGNDRIGSFRWLGLLQGANAGANYPFGNTLTFGNAIGALANADLQWETTAQTNIGFDVSFWDRNVNLTVDYYRKRTEDLLLFPDVSALLGTAAPGSGAPAQNAGIVENRGLDLNLNFNYDFSDDFNIQVGYNITTIDNEAIEVNNAAGFLTGGLFSLNQATSRFQSGLPIGAFWGLKTDGIFQNQAEIDAHAVQPDAQPGDIRYVDIDGDGVIEFGSDEDLSMIGNPIPDFTMGINLNINYKQLDFGTSLYASVGNDIVRSYERFLPQSNRSTLYLNRWTGEGTSNTVPRASNNAANNTLFSDFYVEDGSYLRVQNIQLGYSFSDKILEKFKISRLRLYVAANNLFTFTKYQGFNPDINNADPLSAGVDFGQYPLARTFTTGINVSF
jgi:TonB-linked SusC/RagA family outer membrane protein